MLRGLEVMPDAAGLGLRRRGQGASVAEHSRRQSGSSHLTGRLRQGERAVGTLIPARRARQKAAPRAAAGRRQGSLEWSRARAAAAGTARPSPGRRRTRQSEQLRPRAPPTPPSTHGTACTLVKIHTRTVSELRPPCPAHRPRHSHRWGRHTCATAASPTSCGGGAAAHPRARRV
eukprot:COSAG01_NODE_12007_length_1817_cov_1.516880_2_plen_175_part_00